MSSWSRSLVGDISYPSDISEEQKANGAQVYQQGDIYTPKIILESFFRWYKERMNDGFGMGETPQPGDIMTRLLIIPFDQPKSQGPVGYQYDAIACIIF